MRRTSTTRTAGSTTSTRAATKPDTEPVLLCWLVRPLVGRVRAPQRETAPDHRAHHHHLCDEDLDDHHHLCHDNFLK